MLLSCTAMGEKILPILDNSQWCFLDPKKYPNLSMAIQKENISHSLLHAPCLFNLHKGDKSQEKWLKHLDKIARVNNHFGRDVTTQGISCKLGEFFDELFFQTKKHKGINGEKSLIYSHLFLCELIDQKKIKNFYHIDSPLLEHLRDPEFITKEQCQFLDQLGVDILIETNDGEFIPLQIKTHGGLKPNCKISIDNQDLFIKRKIPTFSFNIKSIEDKTKSFEAFFEIITSVLNKEKKLFSGKKDFINLTNKKILEEFIEKEFIEIESKKTVNCNHRPKSKRKVSKSRICFSEINFGLIQRLENENDYHCNSNVKKVLLEFIKNTDPEKISKYVQKNWFHKINSKNKLGKCFRNMIKNIEENNPGAGYTVENFIRLKEKLTIAFLADNLKEGFQLNESELLNEFNKENFDDDLNSFSQSIKHLLRTLIVKNTELKNNLNEEFIEMLFPKEQNNS